MLRSENIPHEVLDIAEKLEQHLFEAHLVGGCVRDLILQKKPKDWDITTNATPEDIQRIFPQTFSNNDFGTVGVVTGNKIDSTLSVVEITPFRSEGIYSDARRPDNVIFGVSLEEDLKRRDFTINAIAFRPKTNVCTDLFDGLKDLQRKHLRAVGDAETRFQEDALRMMRAVRLAVELECVIENDTMTAIAHNASNLGRISKERIRDELLRILASSFPLQGILLLDRLDLLPYILPDLLRSKGIRQNQAHAFDVYEHLLRTMQHAADKNWSVELRLAGLLHDISKPETRKWSPEKKDWTFYGHEVVGARTAKQILKSLKFPSETTDHIIKLVRWHMFFSDPEQMTLSAVRRTIKNVGEENIWDLLKLRRCDRIGTGRPKEQPFRLRKYTAMVEEALRDPINVGLLAIDGSRLLTILKEKPGPKIGFILHALLEEVIEEPTRNTSAYLEARAVELSALPLQELKRRGEAGKLRQKEEESLAIADIQKKYGICEC